MKALANDKFAASVMGLGTPKRPFKPTATYIPSGDCIEFVVAPDDYKAQRLDGLVTVYYSRKTGKVVGGLIKGVKAFCQRVSQHAPGFRISVEVRPLRLEHVFLAQLWTESPNPSDVAIIRVYEELIKVSGQQDLAVDVGDLCQA